MNVLVTGATGFVGPPIVRKLVEDGHTVRVLEHTPGSSGDLPNQDAVPGSMTDADPKYSTNPCGIVITAEGKTLYHAGDTALTADIKLLGELYRFDCACLPIGDNYTMGPDDALHAARFLSARLVVPMHYDTFPPIQQDAAAWAERVRAETGARCEVLDPGRSVEF